MSLKKILFCIVLMHCNTSLSFFPFFGRAPVTQKIVTVMLDPAGDAQHTGRKIDNNFERSLTLMFAQKLKDYLQDVFPSTQIVLTRDAGETVTSLQNANFANRLHVDLFLSFHFYQETEVKPKIYLYNFSYNDEFISLKQDLTFCRYDQAHLFNYAHTRQYGLMVKQILDSESYKNMFECIGLKKAPIKPCIGIKAPALLFEIGLHEAGDLQLYVEPLVSSLKRIIEMLQAGSFFIS